MAEYLAPGVYVEETSFRSKSIEGVGTSTAAFAGPTLRGPVGGPPVLLTSFGDFERIYGGLDSLDYGRNYLAFAVQAYYDNGGSRLYVSRAFAAGADDGMASADVGGIATLDARFPGSAGDSQVIVDLISTAAGTANLDAAEAGALMRVRTTSQVPDPIVGNSTLPLSLAEGNTLTVTLDDTAGTTASFVATGATAANVTGTVTAFGADVSFDISIDGAAAVSVTATAPADIGALLLDAAITGLAGVTAADAGGDLSLTSDTTGSASSIVITSPVNITFGADGAGTDGNVADLAAVTIEELQAAYASQTSIELSQDEDDNLVISIADASFAGTMTVSGNRASFGMSGGARQNSTGTTTPGVSYVKDAAGDWQPIGGGAAFDPANALARSNPGPGDAATTLVTVNLTVSSNGIVQFFDDLGLGDGHPRFIETVLAVQPDRLREQLENLVSFTLAGPVDAETLAAALVPTGTQNTFALSGGNDGVEPAAAAYGDALQWFERVDDIFTVATPGSAAYADGPAIQQELLIHVGNPRRYRTAVLDTPPNFIPDEARDWRAEISALRGALYYPWVIISNPLARPGDAREPREIAVPPSGFIAGIYARNDVERGVFKAPANEVVRGALRFEYPVNFAEQEVLNPLGVNCLRFFPGQGYRVWGARTTTTDPEWKYVNVRRYFHYLESSIERGTQWAVFEPNGERLWANVRETIDSFLYNEWRNGALLGASAKEAYFVRCDRSTMTQNDIDNGRLVCLIGVAALKPAEFVIFRIGQKTADARD